MNNYVFSLLFLVCFSWLGCNCPPDEQKGELNLEQKAQDFVLYDGTETLVFKDESGSELNFTAPRGMELTTDKLCYRTICTEAKFGSPSSCEYFDAESRRFTYFTSDNSAVLDILIYSDVYDYGMAQFYDALQVGLSIGAPSLSANHLIEVRIDPPIDLAKINLNDVFIETAEVELNGQTFTDVLVFEQATLGVYFQEGKGVIGFKNDEHTWVVQD